MTQLQIELDQLKADITEMWMLVGHQLDKAMLAVKTFDKNYAREMIAGEKRVNSMELKIDRDCENIFALFNPVAIDLRFVLAILKINNNLERIGDIAESTGKYITTEKKPFDEILLEKTKLYLMFDAAKEIINDVLIAFNTEDTHLARSVFGKDAILDDIDAAASRIIAIHLRENIDLAEQALNVHAIIRRLERVGDQCKNIAEEIIFYLEAKVIKHK